MIRYVVVFSLLTACAFGSEQPASSVLPSDTLIPGAPTTKCSFPDIDTNTPIRITKGDEPLPYQFACGENRPLGVCASATLPLGLVVSLGEERNGWACVTGGDSTSGWVPSEYLTQVPTVPKVPLAAWLGWWRLNGDEDVKGEKGNRLLIYKQHGSNVLHVRGWAFNNGHIGGVNADAIPIGIYLHVVNVYARANAACVVDLMLDVTTHTLQAYDNMNCGGMNVRFTGTWNHSAPTRRSQ